jgi:hypothetical protein
MAAKADTTEVVDTTIPNWRFDVPRKARFTVDRIVTARTTGIGGNELQYPLLTVTDKADGVVYLLHAYPETLLAELKRVQPSVGDEIDVDYQGVKETKSQRNARIFVVDSPNAAAFAWDSPNF